MKSAQICADVTGHQDPPKPGGLSSIDLSNIVLQGNLAAAAICVIAMLWHYHSYEPLR